MRYLFVAYRDAKNPTAVGGDSYLWELAKGASNVGNKVTFVCSAFKGSKREEVLNGVEVVRFAGNQRLPFSIFNAYMRRWKGSFDLIVEEAIGGERPPFLMTTYVKEPLTAVWHQRHYRIFRGQYPFPLWVPLALLEVFLARVYGNRTILTPSMGAKVQLMRLGFRSEKVKVVFDGVGEVFDRASKDGERDDTIVCLGKLRRYKRFDHSLLALKLVQSRVGKPIRLIIAGRVSEIDRGYVESLRQLAERLGLSDSVEFKFNISEREKLTLLEKARLLVQPSPVEGFSVVVLEANRCGTPVVVSDGIPKDVVIDGYNGLVYPYAHIEAFADAITKLMCDDSLWSKMSRNGWTWSQRYSWENSVQEFTEIAEDLSSSQGVT